MKLIDLLASGSLVQAVYVLGQYMDLFVSFKFGNCYVPRIWLCRKYILPSFFIPFPDKLGVFVKGIYCSKLHRIIFSPKTILSSKCWNPAFLGNTCTGYKD